MWINNNRIISKIAPLSENFWNFSRALFRYQNIATVDVLGHYSEAENKSYTVMPKNVDGGNVLISKQSAREVTKIFWEGAILEIIR
jgi:hypothetical protein